MVRPFNRDVTKWVGLKMIALSIEALLSGWDLKCHALSIEVLLNGRGYIWHTHFIKAELRGGP